MTRFLDRIGEGRPVRTIEMGTNETIKQAVMAGLGIALISRHTVMEEIRHHRLVALRDRGHADRPPLVPRPRRRPPAAARRRAIARAIVEMEGAFLPDHEG